MSVSMGAPIETEQPFENEFVHHRPAPELSTWEKLTTVGLIVLVIAAVLYVTVLRYSLVSQSINAGRTAITGMLLAPELGRAFALIMGSV